MYFWRWATWKVFDHHPTDDRGVVCFITAAGFLTGPGFQAMRRYLRRRCDAIWVIDCSPEAHQPPVGTRVFQGVQQPVCIVIALRDGSTGADEPATVRHRRLREGSRQDKFTELSAVTLDDGWSSCPDDWRAPFSPTSTERWSSFPALDDLLYWSGSGTMPGRTWVVAPEAETLRWRWQRLVTAKPEDKPELFTEHPTDRRVDTVLSDNLPGYAATPVPIGMESGPCPPPVRIGYRSFDRQWIIPDKRVINQPNPALWAVRSDRQVYLTALTRTSPTSGPGLTFSALVPDLDHYHGRGGRAYPLWLDAAGTRANVVPGLLDLLAECYARAVSAPDLFGYLAAVCAHPGYPAAFAVDLATPGLRVPLTADAELFDEAAELGRRVIWLHSYGERFADPAAGRRPPAPPAAAAEGRRSPGRGRAPDPRRRGRDARHAGLRPGDPTAPRGDGCGRERHPADVGLRGVGCERARQVVQLPSPRQGTPGDRRPQGVTAAGRPA